MKISEVAGQKLMLMPAYVAVINGMPKSNVSKFEFDGEHECGDCNGTGLMRRRGIVCPSCQGKGTVQAKVPRPETPILYYTTNRFNYLKQKLNFKVDGGIIYRAQIPEIRRNIIIFMNSDLSYIYSPEINRAKKPSVEIDKKTRLSTIVPNREYKREVTPERVIPVVNEFDQFLAEIQKINGASVIIKDEF